MPQYALLASLFSFVLCFEAHFLLDLYHDFTFSYSASPISVGTPWPAITSLNGEAAKNSGLRVGDRVVSVDGRPLRGQSDLMRPIRLKRPGQTVQIVVDRAGMRDQVVLPLSSVRTRQIRPIVYTYAAVMFCLMPVLSILLGFGVAVIRPRDPMAWLLLAMLLSFTLLTNGNVTPLGWPAWLRIPAQVYLGFGDTWPACILLFAIYFNHRFRLDAEFPWIKWLLLVPLGLMSVLGSGMSLGISESYRSAGSFFEKLYAQLRPAKDVTWALTLCVVLFTIGWKSRDPGTGKDGRRRLRMLLFGATVSLTPVASLLIYIQFEQYRDNIWSALALMLTFVFPVTMAYVIVVERAMDLRVVIRQGLQYTLARRGVLILQILLSTILFIVLAMLMTSHALSPLEYGGGSGCWTLGHLPPSRRYPARRFMD